MFTCMCMNPPQYVCPYDPNVTRGTSSFPNHIAVKIVIFPDWSDKCQTRAYISWSAIIQERSDMLNSTGNPFSVNTYLNSL